MAKIYILIEDWAYDFNSDESPKDMIRGAYTNYNKGVEAFNKELDSIKREVAESSKYDKIEEDLSGEEKYYSAYQDGSYCQYHINLSLVSVEGE